MFACLQLNTKEARLFDRRRSAVPVLQRVEPPGGAPFFRLECRKSGKDLPWRDIERAAGRLRTRMLFPQDVVPPAPPPARSAAQAQLEPGLRAFVPKRLPLLLSMHTAQQVIRAAHVPARELRITVVDTKGALCRQLEPLIPLAGSLRICTPEPSLYRAAAQQLQQRYGIALIISSSAGCFAQSHVVVADSLELFTGKETGLIFTPDVLTAQPGCRVVRCGPPVLPAAFAQLCPPGIDPLQFACALYELCGIKEMERLLFSHYSFGNTSQHYTLEELAHMLRRSCLDCLVRL